MQPHILLSFKQGIAKAVVNAGGLREMAGKEEDRRENATDTKEKEEQENKLGTSPTQRMPWQQRSATHLRSSDIQKCY